MKFNPEPYQLEGIKHLTSNKRAGLFAGMGLGKTAMSLAAADELFRDAAIHGVLVVAPIRVINLTWPSEIEGWDEFNWMEYANLRTKKGISLFKERGAHIYGINYESLPTLCHNVLQYMDPAELPFDLVIWDELTKAKNPSAFRINTFRKQCPDIPRRWGLTGSPMPNDKLDLFAQVRLLDDGERFGTAYYKFRSKYFYSVDKEQHKWVLRNGGDTSLEEKLNDLVLVLKSEDYLDIPEMRVEDVEIALPEKAKKAYKELEKELYMLLDHKEIEAVNAAALVIKLLQITSGAVYDSERNVIRLHDAKLDALEKVFKASQEEGENLMVAYQFQHEADRIRERFPDALFFKDFRTHCTQKELCELWNAGAVPMLVAHPDSVGHGLNLQHGGSRICWFSIGWNRELFDQMNARVARKGQTKPTTITRLLVSKTVDDAVAEALRKKGESQNDLLDALKFFKQMKGTN